MTNFNFSFDYIMLRKANFDPANPATQVNNLASETTLKEVKKAIENINVNVGDIVVGDIAVTSNDTTTHNKLDTLNATLTNKHLNKATDSIDISGQMVDISGQTVVVSHLNKTTDSVDISGQKVDISGQTVVVAHLNKTVDSVDISGQRVDISGQSLIVNTISGFSTSTLQTSGNNLLTDIKNKHLDSVTDSVTVNTITGFATDAKQDTQIEELNKIANKKGDIEGNVYYPNAEIWADSEPQPELYPQNPNGWLYINAELNNALNLYYFNGVNETKTLSQVVGQYAVVSNFTTKLLNSLIFGIYTKGTPFFTTRITHSQPNNVNLTAGGKFLCYWGQVPDDIYPNLPRLNFTDTTTTGPAIPTEEILSISFNTNSIATPFDVVIFIESLGVVFNNSGVNQSRVVNLLSTDTEYAIQTNIQDTLQAINTGVNINNPITNFATETGGNLASIKANTDKNTYTGNALNVIIPHLNKTTDSVDISGQTVVVAHLNKTTDSVDISGQTVVVAHLNKTTDSVDISGQKVDISGQTVVVAHLNKTTDSVDISGQTVVVAHLNKTTDSVDISGQTVVVAHLNKTTDSVDISGQKVDISGQTVVVAHLNKTTDSVDISGQKVDISGQTVAIAHLNKTTDSVDISGQTVVVAHLNKTTDSVDISGQKVDISGQTVNLGSIGSLDTHCFASSNGTNWHHLASDANGQLNVHSKLQDGAGSDLTSTLNGAKRSLDVNVSNTVPVSGTFYQSTQPVAIKDGENNPLTSTDTTATTRSLDTASCLYTTDASVRSALTSTLNGAKRSLDVNVSNTVPISGSVGISSGAKIIITDGTDDMAVNSIPSSITTTKGINTQSLLFTETQNNTLEIGTSTVSTNFNAVDVNLTAYNLSPAGDYARLTSRRPVLGTEFETKALEVANYNYAFNPLSNICVQLTTTETTPGVRNSLDVNVNNASTQNFTNKTGINVAPQLMKFKTYVIDAGAQTGANTILTGNSGIIIDINNAGLIFGASYPKNFFLQITGTGATSKSVLIDYVDITGVEYVGVVFTATTTNTQILSGIWGVNRCYLNTAFSQQILSNTETITVSYTQNTITVPVATMIRSGENQMSYTAPINYVACVPYFQFTTQATDNLNISKFSANGTRIRMRYWNSANTFITSAPMSDGGVSGFTLSTGDTLVFSTEGSGSTSKRVSAMINTIALY